MQKVFLKLLMAEIHCTRHTCTHTHTRGLNSVGLGKKEEEEEEEAWAAGAVHLLG